MLFCPETHHTRKENAMNEFISRYRPQLSGTLAGFDRLVFRGNLSLVHEAGMKGYLWASKVAWKDYAAHVTAISQEIKTASLQAMENSGGLVRHLNSGKHSKSIWPAPSHATKELAADRFARSLRSSHA